MNIFVLSNDPIQAAQMQCNKHVVKMILESAQLLCTAHAQDDVPYKHTHFNHPCAKWVRESRANYDWLLSHALALCEEYTYRYNKEHKTQAVLLNLPEPTYSRIEQTLFPLAMPDEYKVDSVVKSYQNYYKHKAQTINFRYTRREMPEFLQ